MEVQVIEVTKGNLEPLWSKIVKDVKNSIFIALDTEMSGLGPQAQLMKSDLEQRYQGISAAASSRSIISLGLACFEPYSGKEPLAYNVTVYNIIVLCSDPFTIDPGAVSFLVNHGFNFNKQFCNGISYYKGNDRPKEKDKLTMRSLFAEIIKLRKPLVLHNGLVDLVFLYNSLYAELPGTLNSFMADVCEIFPAGIYDCKYIAEFCDRLTASFLLYAFKKTQWKNEALAAAGKICLKVHFKMESEWTVTVPLNVGGNKAISHKNIKGVEICEKYAAYGWCRNGILCKKVHDIDTIVQFHKTSKQKRKRKRTKSSSDTKDVQTLMEQDEIKPTEENANPIKRAVFDNSTNTQGHRSSLDAFMTGYIFATFIASQYTPTPLNENSTTEKENDKKEKFTSEIQYLSRENKTKIVNKLYLSGKPIPLQVTKSKYSKTSKNHNEKLLKVYLS
uniref:target of EGR1 protein 1 n=1 Tax=Ciona intestinalis TaxID=7719 RepID=UPI000180CEF1|nr:target of EGR1 protein 1 [Ciona intestinalis]|eukprot:XP_002129875.1 target of EGR1 protein 1 [Ciona intestinalis]